METKIGSAFPHQWPKSKLRFDGDIGKDEVRGVPVTLEDADAAIGMNRKIRKRAVARIFQSDAGGV